MNLHSEFEARDPNFAERVRSSFERQKIMQLLGARLLTVDPGAVSLELPYKAELSQQHGFVHAGIVSTVLDSACGYAAFSLMSVDAGVLSVEFKVNFVAPAKGERLVANARVRRAGKTLTICQGDAFAYEEGREKLIATMQATIMAVYDRQDVQR